MAQFAEDLFEEFRFIAYSVLAVWVVRCSPYFGIALASGRIGFDEAVCAQLLTYVELVSLTAYFLTRELLLARGCSRC